MTRLHLHLTCLASLTLAACIAGKADDLGEVDDDTSPGSTDTGTGTSATSPQDTDPVESSTSAGTETDPTDPSASTGQAGESTTDTGPPLLCEDTGLPEYFPAGCPDLLLPQLPAAGCYEECTGPGDPCVAGRCTEVQVDPCPCGDDPEACCDACTGSAWLCLDEVPKDACEEIVGRTFTSIEQLECGITPDGVVLCNWSVDFRVDGEFIWMYSDIGEAGTYTCENGIITLTSGQDVAQSYDPVTGVLTWDDVDYQ